MSRSMRILPVLSICVFVVFCSCASGPKPPTSEMIAKGDSYETSISKMKKIAIIDDLVLSRKSLDEGTYVSIEYSLASASYMLEGAAEALKEKGYSVDYMLTPFVGSYCKADTSELSQLRQEIKAAAAEKPDEEEYETAYQKKKAEKKREREEKERQRQLETMVFFVKQIEQEKCSEQEAGPFYTSNIIIDDPEYIEALKGLIAEDIEYALSDTVKEYLSIIKSRVNTDHLLLIKARGVSVSGASQTRDQLATGCLSTVASGGMVTVTQTELSAMTTQMRLYDLDREVLVWSNHGALSGGDPTSKEYYDIERWAREYLYHLPSRKL
jgi:hypothetical protein